MVRLPVLGRSSFQHTRHFATTAHLLSSVLCHGQVLLLLAAYYHMRTKSGDANLVTNLHIYMLPYGIFRKVQGQEYPLADKLVFLLGDFLVAKQANF